MAAGAVSGLVSGTDSSVGSVVSGAAVSAVVSGIWTVSTGSVQAAVVSVGSSASAAWGSVPIVSTAANRMAMIRFPYFIGNAPPFLISVGKQQQ